MSLSDLMSIFKKRRRGWKEYLRKWRGRLSGKSYAILSGRRPAGGSSSQEGNSGKAGEEALYNDRERKANAY